MDLEEARQPLFKEIFKELDRLNFMSFGILLSFYYKYINKQINFGISPIARQWEYSWVIINSEIKKGDRVLDVGRGTGLLWQDFIKASRLSLFGESDFTSPPKDRYSYNVVGFVLRK